jgi:predicted alpha-1,2-mannosidase
MRRKIELLATIFLAWFFIQEVNGQVSDPVSYVSTLVGTNSKYELSTGNTYPAIALPWGMNFWSPQTGKMGDGWMYTYTADKIRGFKQTHQPSPWMNDYGQFSIMPTTGKVVFNEDERASWFSHKSEVAKPYYYSVHLADHDVTAEITPTERAAMFRFTFPVNNKSSIVVDAFDHGSYLKIIPEENKIVGYTTRNSGGVPANFKNYFVIVFDKPFTGFSIVQDGKIIEGGKEFSGNHAGAIVSFSTTNNEQIHARVASSFISEAQASINLKELGDNNFDKVVDRGKDRWNSVLGKIKIEDDNIDNIRTFYSSFYRSVLFPRNFSEVDAGGKIVHYSPYNGEVLPGHMYTDTGFWDTFRSLFPFLNFLFPSENVKMQEGLVNAYK